MLPDSIQPATMPLPSPLHLRKRVDGLLRDLSRSRTDLGRRQRELADVRSYLGLAPQVEEALKYLSQQLFDRVVGLLQDKLTIALQEVLEQPIRLKAQTDFKRGGASVEFCIEREGRHEDIMKGQGGSVTNILSIGLRMFALTALDPKHHRRFLVLDEQDCWLRPDLVPRLVKIIHDAGRALGFQVLLISHHDTDLFERYADRIYRFSPHADGVKVEIVQDDHASS